MKTFRQISVIAAILLLAFIAQAASAGTHTDKTKNNQQNLITIKGRVIDAESRAPLVFATVAVKESNVAIVTNIDGEFTLKVGDLSNSKSIEISFVGYKNKTIPLSELKENGSINIIALEAAPIPIKEIIVKPLDPVSVVEKAINNIGKNYESVPNLMTAFYRETIRKNRTYCSIGEAVVVDQQLTHGGGGIDRRGEAAVGGKDRGGIGAGLARRPQHGRRREPSSRGVRAQDGRRGRRSLPGCDREAREEARAHRAFVRRPLGPDPRGPRRRGA